MSEINASSNRVRERRVARHWSQAELARRAGISRAAVSAIEINRLVPSVAAALAIAEALDCSVEALFAATELSSDSTGHWAWEGNSSRYWCANVQGRLLYYPAEDTPMGTIPHDGSGIAQQNPVSLRRASETLVMATCDPAVGILARLYERLTGYRMLVFPRPSRQALQLLRDGLVHLAGVHLSAAGSADGNATHVRNLVSQPARLLSVATWQDGVALGSSVSTKSIPALVRSRLTWIGREPGSGARQCLDELLHNRPAPRRIARDHRGVAEAIRSGWADAGVCLQIAAEEARLRFLQVRTESYDLAYLQSVEDDPRVQALIRVIRSPEFRRLVGELPGYDTRQAGLDVDVD